MKPIASIRLFTVALALAFLASTARAQMLQNGSFESPTGVAAGSGDDWTASGGAGRDAVLTNSSGYGTTPYGNQFEALGPATNDTQTFNAGYVIGASNTLSLALADLNGAGASVTVSLSGGGMTTPASTTFSLPANPHPFTGALPFSIYSVPFTPLTSASVTITLTTNGVYDTPTSSDTALIDDVVVTPAPEPSTWAMLLLGGAGLLGVARRRHRA